MVVIRHFLTWAYAKANPRGSCSNFRCIVVGLHLIVVWRICICDFLGINWRSGLIIYCIDKWYILKKLYRESVNEFWVLCNIYFYLVHFPFFANWFQFSFLFPPLVLTFPLNYKLFFFSRISRKVRHKNVVQFIGACTKPPSVCIVTGEFEHDGKFHWLQFK